MSRTLSQKKIDQMWACWQEKQTVNSVSEKCRVSYVTVKRYRGLDKWDSRLSSIQGKAMQKADNGLAKRRARQLETLATAYKSYRQQLVGFLTHECPECKHKSKVQFPKLPAKFRDIDTLVRLEEFLSGEPDSREENVLKFQMVNPDGYQTPKPVESEVIDNEQAGLSGCIG